MTGSASGSRTAAEVPHSWLLAGIGLAALMLTVLSGQQYDYVYYAREWAAILAGNDPWDPAMVPANAYGPAHALLAPLLLIHPLLPKLLFVLAWLGSAALVMRAAGPARRAALALGLILLVTPFFVILVPVYGTHDILVAGLALLAIDLRRRGRSAMVAGLLLALATLIKVYPVALLPFLATERRRLDARLLASFALGIAGGVAASWASWGGSFLNILAIATQRPGKMLSIWWFLGESRLSPLRGSAIAQALIDVNAAIVFAGLAGTYVFCWLERLPALTGAVLASIMLLILYKVGNPQYFILPVVLLLYFVAVEAGAGRRAQPALLSATALYLLVLNGFEAWYTATGGSRGFPEIRAVIGLPACVAALLVLYGVARQEGACREAGGGAWR